MGVYLRFPFRLSKRFPPAFPPPQKTFPRVDVAAGSTAHADSGVRPSRGLETPASEFMNNCHDALALAVEEPYLFPETSP